MAGIVEKFHTLGVENAPGQEGTKVQAQFELKGEALAGAPVDFSHGDVNAHPPTVGSLGAFCEGVLEGASQAYTEYRGRYQIRAYLGERISAFTGAAIDPKENIILTNGTQGALFLAMGANVMPGDKVAYIEPDYFANRKMVEFFGGVKMPIQMRWTQTKDGSGIDLAQLEEAFQAGAKLFVFSNPNNPTGVIYSKSEVEKIAALAKQYQVTLIVDELYSRQIYPKTVYTHLCACKDAPADMITIMGPSKTESLSGYRLGVAFGTAAIVKRMEKLQAIMSLRCAGYNQAAFATWFNEPEGWLDQRILAHQKIRDDIIALLQESACMEARVTEGGSYLFIKLPELAVSLDDFVMILRKQAAVTITPGTEFGPKFTQWFRINISQDHDKALDAIRRTIELVKRYQK